MLRLLFTVMLVGMMIVTVAASMGVGSEGSGLGATCTQAGGVIFVIYL